MGGMIRGRIIPPTQAFELFGQLAARLSMPPKNELKSVPLFGFAFGLPSEPELPPLEAGRVMG
jgi:hypothetical protein